MCIGKKIIIIFEIKKKGCWFDYIYMFNCILKFFWYFIMLIILLNIMVSNFYFNGNVFLVEIVWD